MSRQRLGFIGLGLMGTAMSLRLLDKGWPLTVWNLEPERVPPVVAAGAVAAPSPAAVAEASDVVLMCVLHTKAVEDCVFGANGVAQANVGGKILIDHSTIDPSRTSELAARLQREKGIAWIDAPVSGGPIAARNGTMTVMAGGAAADIEAVQAIMADLSANFTHMGPNGAGQMAKVINQAIVGTSYVMMAEALALAEASGIDAARLPQCLAGGHADSDLLQTLYPRMQARDFTPRAYARQLLKDMHAVGDIVEALGLTLPLVETAIRQHEAFVTPDNEMTDPAAITQLYQGKDKS
jgi:3-hydroxyisobutyrate dehydrogenase